MESKNMISGIVSLAVVVICVALIMMPVLSDATTATKTITNEGTTFALADAEDEDTHTLVFTSDDGGNIAITFDGESCEVPDMSLYSAASVIYAKSTFVRLASNGVMYMYGANGASTYGQLNLGNCLSADITFTITGNSASITVSSTSYTISNMYAYIADEGTYCLAANPYVNEDTTVYAGAINTIGGYAIGIVTYGALDDLTAKAVVPSGRTVGDPVVTTENVCTDLYTLSSIVVPCYNGDTLLGNMTINYLLAPKEITYDNPEYVGSGSSAILNAVPVMVIAALIIGAVGIFVTGRRD